MAHRPASGTTSHPALVKIGELTPAHNKFNLLFELIEIKSRNNGTLSCRVVDDTGIVNAIFSHYSEKLESGVVYYMTNLICKVVEGHLQILMSENTSVTKEPDRLGFRDKANDISKKSHAEEGTNQANTLTVRFNPDSHLIPFSKEEAEEQIRLKREFVENMKRQEVETQKGRAKDQREDKNKNSTKAIPTPSRGGEPEPDKKRNGKNYKEAGEKKSDKPKYKEKIMEESFSNAKPVQAKNEYKPKLSSPDLRKTKSKSVIYRLKDDEGHAAPQDPEPNQEYQRPKFVEKKENCGEIMELIQTVAHVGSHVNLRVWICSNWRNETPQGYELMVADKTGSVWLKVCKLKLEVQSWYEIDNLEVLREEGRLLLSETDFSEARQLDEVHAFNLIPISGK